MLEQRRGGTMATPVPPVRVARPLFCAYRPIPTIIGRRVPQRKGTSL